MTKKMNIFVENCKYVLGILTDKSITVFYIVSYLPLFIIYLHSILS